MTSRSWCFTINNYTLAEQMDVEEASCRYLVYGLEKGDKGTPHMQGYLEFEKPIRISALKKLPGFERAHFEKRRGTREEADEYCKKDGEYFTKGDFNAGGQGKRTDLQEIMDMVKSNIPKITMMEAKPDTYARNMRFIEAYKAEIEKDTTRDFRKVEVNVLWGDAGTGKTRKVHEENEKVFTVNTDEAFPFDGYDGESTILLDDFYGGIKYHNLLRILDGHQYRVNVKGGHRYAQWTKVYITSNKQPSEWYQTGLTPALQRRLTSVTKFCNEVGGNTKEAPTPDYSINLWSNVNILPEEVLALLEGL